MPDPEFRHGHRKRLFVDMDGTLVDFRSGVHRLPDQLRDRYAGHFDDAPGIFALMDPMPGALAAFTELATLFDAFILSTAPWRNPTAWSDKLQWVHRHFGVDPGTVAYKRLILSHRKDLLLGEYLIDDRDRHGAAQFPGEHLQFGAAGFPDWSCVLEYLRPRASWDFPG